MSSPYEIPLDNWPDRNIVVGFSQTGLHLTRLAHIFGPQDQPLFENTLNIANDIARRWRLNHNLGITGLALFNYTESLEPSGTYNRGVLGFMSSNPEQVSEITHHVLTTEINFALQDEAQMYVLSASGLITFG